MSNTSSSTTPTVKRHGHGYTRRVKRLINLLSSGAGNLSRAERAAQGHFWLDASFEDSRRLRSPAERLRDSQTGARKATVLTADDTTAPIDIAAIPTPRLV